MTTEENKNEEIKIVSTNSEQQYSNKAALKFATAPTNDEGIDRDSQLDFEQILKYFELITGSNKLADDETIRLTTFDTASPYKAEDFDKLTPEQKKEMRGGTTTSYEQIRSGKELVKVMNKVYDTVFKKQPSRMTEVGFSISAGIFNYVNNKAPSESEFKRIKTFVFDMDAKEAPEEGASRFPFNKLVPESQQIWAIHLLRIANSALHNSGIGIRFTPIKTYATGGGLQFIIKFDEYLDKEQAKRVFNAFKISLQKADKYHNMSSFIKSDNLIDLTDGSVKDENELIRKMVSFEFDTSSLDITHTQRCGGTVNPKKIYGRPFAHEIKMPSITEKDNIIEKKLIKKIEIVNGKSIEVFKEIKRLKNDYTTLIEYVTDVAAPAYANDVLENELLKHEQKILATTDEKLIQKLNNDKPTHVSLIDDFIKGLKRIILDHEPWIEAGMKINDINRRRYYAFENNIPLNKLYEIKINVDPKEIHTKEIIHSSEIIEVEKSVSIDQNNFLMKSENISMYEIIKKVSPRQQYEYMVDIIGEPLQLGHKFDKFLCPFHEETSPSFAIYHNGASTKDQKDNNGPMVLSVDFHPLQSGELANHNMITLAQHVKNKGKNNTDPDWVTISDIINDVVSKLSLSLTKTEKNTINKVEEESNVANLLKKIDVDKKIYYRKANKMKDCVIREFTNGTYEIFDGTRSMTDHILRVHLKEVNKSLEFRQIFHDAFVEKILINAFEEFSPGNDNRFNLEGNEYVNMWVACDAHNKVHELSETINEMDLTSALELIAERLPASNYFLHQLTQKGSIEYFTNWLVNVAKYKVMPSIPVITSVQGTGKGIFIKQWLKYYLGDQYTNVVTSDKLGSNFNAFMETSSMLALDEGDFSNTKDVDTLKFLSGNDKIQLEKKGVDSVQKDKYFNMVMLTNGDTPLKHPSNDRRITYFRLDASMDLTINYTPWETINDFIDVLQTEAREFWAILLKTKSVSKWEQMNLKDNQFNKQILQMHAFGEFALKVINNEWDDIEFQLNEKVIDEDVETMNSNTVLSIRNEFEQTNMIGLTLINKYLASLKYQSYITIENFIKQNQLHKNGISMVKHQGRMKIKIEREKAKRLIYMPNNLGKLFDDFKDKNIDKTLGTYTSEDIVEDEGLQVHPTSITIPKNEVKPADPLNLHPSVVPPSPISINTEEM